MFRTARTAVHARLHRPLQQPRARANFIRRARPLLEPSLPPFPHSSRLQPILGRFAIPVIGITLIGIGVSLVFGSPRRYAETSITQNDTSNVQDRPKDCDDDKDDTINPRVRNIRLAELRNHGKESDRIWVHKGTDVYDITDWISAHPGGLVILQAAGSSIDAFWKIFTIHQKQEVYDILATYKIGEIDQRDLVDGCVPVDEIEDPFRFDPVRDGRLITLSDKPRNAETPTTELGGYTTSNDTFYVRNHLWVPTTNPEEYKLVVELSNGEEKEYSLDDLKTKFDKVDIIATLQCSGNRRSDMTKNARPTSGLQWSVGAIGNAKWSGARLVDVLRDAGLDVVHPPEHARHAVFVGEEAYGASIPLEKAVDPRGDVLLVYEMNDVPLPRDHGFPIRVIVPGTVAARSVKWLQRITVSEEESTSQWQRRDYKCFGPNEGDKPDWEGAFSIQETPVQSAITSLREVSRYKEEDRQLLRIYGLEEDSIALAGYAFAGGGRRIARVDISLDGGHTWRQAELLPPLCPSTLSSTPGSTSGNSVDSGNSGNKSSNSGITGKGGWGWRRWEYVCPKREVGMEIVCKAVDEGYNTQPDHFRGIYNFRGNLGNAWHRVQTAPGQDSSF